MFNVWDLECQCQCSRGRSKNTYKICVKHSILNLGHALLPHYEAPIINKPHEYHLEGSWGHLGASSEPSGGNLGASCSIWGHSPEAKVMVLLNEKRHVCKKHYFCNKPSVRPRTVFRHLGSSVMASWWIIWNHLV